jgi:hypothetical protein
MGCKSLSDWEYGYEEIGWECSVGQNCQMIIIYKYIYLQHPKYQKYNTNTPKNTQNQTKAQELIWNLSLQVLIKNPEQCP